jgi:hypothetical protein
MYALLVDPLRAHETAPICKLNLQCGSLAGYPQLAKLTNISAQKPHIAPGEASA